jgi:hypothetical protein
MIAQQTKLDDLLNNMKAMQKALVNQQYKEYELSIDNHQRILADIQNIEKERIKLLNSFLGNVKNFQNKNIHQLIFEKLEIKNKNEIDRYLEIRDRIAELIKDVSKYNFQNLYLIENSRKFIRDLIITLFGSKNQKLLDRKV